MASTTIDFEKFEISRTTGFATELPASLEPKFQPWHDLANKTFNLMTSQTMKEETDKMPLIDSSSLTTFKELRLAQLQLSIIAWGYVWEKGIPQARKSLPACVAIPLCDVSDHLGVQSGYSYFSQIGNWERIDPNGPFTKDNIKVRYILPGAQQAVDFNIMNVHIEFSFTKVFPAIENILEGTKQNNATKVTFGLKSLTQWVKDLKVLSEDFHKMLQPEIFFKKLVPFFSGFNEGFGMPEGMLYEGVTDRPKRKLIDVAASQTAIFQIIDTLLQIQYPPEQESYFQNKRESWPAVHRDFFNVLTTWPGSVKQMAESSSALKSAREETVEAVKQFRSYHLQLFTKFSLIPSKRERCKTKETGPDPMTHLLNILKGIRNVTSTSKLEK